MVHLVYSPFHPQILGNVYTINEAKSMCIEYMNKIVDYKEVGRKNARNVARLEARLAVVASFPWLHSIPFAEPVLPLHLSPCSPSSPLRRMCHCSPWFESHVELGAVGHQETVARVAIVTHELERDCLQERIRLQGGRA